MNNSEKSDFNAIAKSLLTKREMFAMAAMQGILSSYEVQKDLQDDARFTGGNFANVVALNAIEFADALLKQLESSKPE